MARTIRREPGASSACWRSSRRRANARDRRHKRATVRHRAGERTASPSSMRIARKAARFARPLARPPAARFARGLRPLRLYFAAAHGRSEAKSLEVAPRQASRDAQDLGAEAHRVPAVPPAEAPAPRLPDLRHLSRPRGRAARDPRSLEAP